MLVCGGGWAGGQHVLSRVYTMTVSKKRRGGRKKKRKKEKEKRKKESVAVWLLASCCEAGT
jgi:hypothetical protein